METKPDGGPAFPMPAEQCVYDSSQGMIGTEGYGRGPEYGMSVRDYFAAKCDISQYAPVDVFYRTYGRNPDASELAEMIATIRYIEADAMLAARSA